MLFEATIRRFTEWFSGAGPKEARATGLESIAVAQTEPPGVELTRAGRRFMLGNNAAITGIANGTALPTTAAQWVLWNPDVKKTYFFEEIGMYLTSGTPGVGGVLLACLFRTPAQLGASVTGTAIVSCSQGSLTSKMIVKNGVTITDSAAPVWYFLATNPSPNVTAFAASTYLEHRTLQGRIAVPPGYGLGLSVVAPAGTNPLFAPFATWVELASDLE